MRKHSATPRRWTITSSPSPSACPRTRWYRRELMCHELRSLHIDALPRSSPGSREHQLETLPMKKTLLLHEKRFFHLSISFVSTLLPTFHYFSLLFTTFQIDPSFNIIQYYSIVPLVGIGLLDLPRYPGHAANRRGRHSEPRRVHLLQRVRSLLTFFESHSSNTQGKYEVCAASQSSDGIY